VSPESAPLAVCRSLSKTYATASGGIEALHSVDASFALGEITAVVGASGSGKSTLLKALAGLDRTSSGSLVVAGTELAEATPSALRRHRRTLATYVNQKAADNFIPYLTVAEQAEGDHEAAVELLTGFGLAHRVHSLPAELSGGEQARAAFALALLRGTPLLIADEPTAELDTGSAAPLLETIRSHAGAGTAFVIATHDPDVMAIADTVLRLERGRVISPDEQPVPLGRSSPRSGGGEPVVTVRGVTKSFRAGPETIAAVKETTLELRRGDLGALVGRSGSGKTTLLTLLSGLLAPDDGEIVFSGVGDASKWSELAFLPQRFGLLPELSVRENVEFPARLAGTLETGRARADALLEQLGLAEHADRPPQETSIGQQQRTALARALVLEPALLIADEPTSHQDAGWRDGVWRLLVEAAEAGTTAVIATHEDDIARYATRVWEISEGVVAETR
jgi:putative ABC transport system ATP-binding protein